MHEPTIIAQKMFVQMLMLLVLSLSALVLATAKFLPDDPLVLALPYTQVSGLSHVLLEAALLTGLFAVAVYQLTESPRELYMLYYAWGILLLLIMGTGLLNILEGRYLLEMPPGLDAAIILLVVIFRRIILRDRLSPIWALGTAVVIACLLLGLIPPENPLSDRVSRTISVGLRYNVGYTLMALASFYPLVDEEYLYRLAGWLTILGAIACLPPLTGIGLIPIPAWYLVPVVLVSSIGFLYSVPTYRGWFGFGASYLAFALCALGTLLSIPAAASYTLGTHLSQVQHTMVSIGILGLILGFFDPHGAHNRFRYWLMIIGFVLSSLSIVLVGVVQVYAERFFGIGYLDAQQSFVGLYALHLLSLLLALAGIFGVMRRFLRWS